MKQYFTKVTADYWNSKNKNQEDAKNIARSLQNLLIDEEDLNDFIEHLRNEIKLANERNKRCKPLELVIWNELYSLDEGTKCGLSVEGVFRLSIYNVTGKWNRK